MLTLRRLGLATLVLAVGAGALSRADWPSEPAKAPSAATVEDVSPQTPPSSGVAAVATTARIGTAARASGAPRTVASTTSGKPLAEPMHGRAAVTALGDRLPVVARLNQRSAPQLTTLLTDDPTMWLDTSGQLFVKDALPPEDVSAASPSMAAAPMASPSFPLDQTFALHSLPGSHRTIYLDFDGVDVGNIAWTGQGLAQGHHAGWDPMNDGDGFTDRERIAIQETWARVAEDYAPFDVDVTTQDPGEPALTKSSPADLDYGTHLVVTDSSTAWQALCSSGCGGIAWIGRFGGAESAGQYQLAWVFADGAGDYPRTIAEAAAHEIGHTLNLTHDGTSTQGYDVGHTPWAPIMGAGYYQGVTQWSKGDYADANNQQDDVAIIAARAPFRADEAGDSRATAASVPSGTAYITSRSDVDRYNLGTCTGPVTAAAKPAATGPDLDVTLKLVDGAGNPVASAAPATTQVNGPEPYAWANGTITAPQVTGMDAAISASLPTGRYYAVVDGGGAEAGGAGDPVADYDDYGSLGAYTLTTTGCDLAAAAAPGAPTGMTTTITAADGLKVAWAAPTDDGGSALVGYDVSLDGAAPERVAATVTSRTWPTVTTGSHTVSVVAVNAVGSGPAGTGAARRTTAGAPLLLRTYVAPDPAGDPDAPNPTRYFWIHWAPPADNGGSPVLSYRLEIELWDGWDFDYQTLAAPHENNFTDYGVGVGLGAGDEPIGLRVIPVTAVGDGTPLYLEGQIPGPPPMIYGDNLRVTTDKYEHTIRVDWDVPFDGGSPLLGTHLALQTGVPYQTPDVWPVHQRFEVAADGTRSVLFTDVPEGQTLLTVQPYNEWGFRQSGRYVDMPVLPTPDYVSQYDPVVVDARHGTATVSWRAPNTDPHLPILGYDVDVDGGTPVRVTGTTLTATGLALGSRHTVNVSAVNRIGGSTAWGPTFFVRTTPLPVTDVEAHVVVDNPANLQVGATWTEAADNGGVPGYREYRWRLQPVGGDDAAWQPAFGPQAVASSVAPGQYTLQVRSHNEYGDSTAVEVPVTVTAPSAPGAITELDVTDLDASTGTANVRWTEPVDDGSHLWKSYLVDLIDTTTGDTRTRWPAYGLWAQIQNLTAGHTYRVEVTAQNAAGQGPTSSTTFTVARTAPGEVTTLQTFADRRYRTVNVSWYHPQRTGGAPIQRYDVRIDGGDWTELPATTYSFTFTNVSAGAHVVDVRAENGALDGDDNPLASTTSSTVVMEPEPVAPGAVSGLRVAPDAAHGSMTVSWAAPADDGGSPVFEYVVNIGSATYMSSETSLRVPGLAPGVYRVTVAARTMAGMSPLVGQTVTLTTVPGAPRIGTAKAGHKGGAATAIFGWAAPTSTGGSDVTGYEVTVVTLKNGKKVSSKAYPVAAKLGSFEIKLPVKKGITYAAVVRAKSAVGWSPFSAQSKAVTPQ